MGCDETVLLRTHWVKNFNPRTRMGCDDYAETFARQLAQFQSTHPHGVRLCLDEKFELIEAISIHAPAWGATSCCLRRTPTTSHFNPRTRMGCDQQLPAAHATI